MSDVAPALAGHSFGHADAAGFGHNPEPVQQGPSAGTLLRRAREAAGLHIAALAVSLKVPVKKLEALEQDRYDLLPDLVFARALASSVCRTLKVDAGPVLERLPQTAAPQLATRSASINAPFRSPRDGPGPSMFGQLSRPVVLAGLALLLGALVLIFLPDIKLPVQLQSSMGSSPAAGVAGPDTAGQPAAQAGEPLAGGLISTGSLSSLTPAANSGAAPMPAAAPVATASATLSAAASLANPGAPAEAGGIVTFSATSESWVKVTDAKGAVVLRRTLAPGESAAATGALPLTVIVGRADTTQVLVRGQVLNLSAMTRDNVARFEVK